MVEIDNRHGWVYARTDDMVFEFKIVQGNKARFRFAKSRFGMSNGNRTDVYSVPEEYVDGETEDTKYTISTEVLDAISESEYRIG